MAKLIKPKRRSITPKIKWLSDTPTFGAIIPADHPTHVQGGFIYKITLTHPKLQNFEYIYVGQKHWNKGHDWTRYQSSSKKVIAMLGMGFIPKYELIQYCKNSKELNNVEYQYITQQWMTPELRDHSINFGCSHNGTKQSRYKWCMFNLQQIDKRY